MDLATYAVLNKKIDTIGNVPDEKITEAVNTYLEENPVAPGATSEQAEQIQDNTNKIDELKSDLDLYSNVVIDTQPVEYGWLIGGISYSNGAAAESTIRLRTGFIPVNKNTSVKLMNTAYEYIVYEYTTPNSTTNLIARTADSWMQGRYSIQSDDCKFIRICIRNKSNPSAVFSDITAGQNIIVTNLIPLTDVCRNIYPVWEKNSIEHASGNNITKTSRIRTRDFIPCGVGTTVKSYDSNWQFTVYLYDDQYTFVGISTPNDSDDYTVTDTRVKYIRLSGKKVTLNDDYDISISEGAYFYIYATKPESGYEIHKSHDFELGSVAYTTGYDQDKSDGTRIRTVGYVPMRYGDVIRISDNILSNHSYLVYEYSTQQVSRGILVTHTGSDWQIEKEYYPTSKDCYFVKIVFKTNDGSATNLSMDDLKNGVYFYNKPVKNFYPLITPAMIPSGVYHAESVAEEGTSFVDYTTVIGWWDSLATAYPEYVTKNTLGKDASGTYDLYSYTFTPFGISYVGNRGHFYRDTELPVVILDAGIHGNEKPCVKALYNMMQKICSDWQNDDILAFMHWNLKFVCIPVANPYGFEQGGSNAGIRVNSNGVNLNRNFNAGGRWSDGDSDPTSNNYRGSAPLSESEAQIIDNVLQTYKNNALVYYNFHTVGIFSSWEKMTSFDMADILEDDAMGNVGITVTKEVTVNGWRYHNVPTDITTYIGLVVDDSSLAGCAGAQAQTYGIQAAIPEVMYKFYDGDSVVIGRETADASRLNVEYMVSCIMNACRQFLKPTQLI